MTKTLFFRDSMMPEAILLLIEKIQNYMAEPPQGEVGTDLRIFFDSDGGEDICLLMLLATLEDHKDRITLVFASEIYSAAFMLMLFAPCKVKLTWDSAGIIHPTSMKLHYNSAPASKHTSTSFVWSKQLNAENATNAKMLREAGLGERKSELFRKGRDVAVSRKKMLKMREKVQQLIQKEDDSFCKDVWERLMIKV